MTGFPLHDASVDVYTSSEAAQLAPVSAPQVQGAQSRESLTPP